MATAFGFSVGDFIAVLHLVGSVVDALRESSHASSSFRSLINELYALETALLRVKRLEPDEGHHVERVALRQAASQCQQTIDLFYKKIQKDQPHLQKGGTDSKIKDAWVKIKWAICKKEDLETFRAEIRGHTGSIELLLLTVQMEATTMQARKQDSQHESLGGRMQAFACQTMGMLKTISDNVAQSIQHGKELLESSAQVVQTNLRVFQVVHDIQLFIFKIPGQIQRQQPVYLIDPLNRESPFHLEFVRSAEALLAVLRINLKESSCGPAMIDRGEFMIEESGTQDLIDLARPWDNCFYPGQRVTMSMVFKGQPGRPRCSCPRCGKDHQTPTRKEISCVDCGTVFRRIEEVVENTQGPTNTINSDQELESGDLPRLPFNGPAEPPKKRKREEDDMRRNLREFRRIRLVSTPELLGISSGPNRCKVYELRNNDWYDRGIGFCQAWCEGTTARKSTARLVVQSEDKLSLTLLNRQIFPDDGYQQQQDTLIVWTEANGTDMALSFQEAEGCMEIWEIIKAAQGKESIVKDAQRIRERARRALDRSRRPRRERPDEEIQQLLREKGYDPNSKVDVKRARNTLAVRKSRQRMLGHQSMLGLLEGSPEGHSEGRPEGLEDSSPQSMLDVHEPTDSY